MTILKHEKGSRSQAVQNLRESSPRSPLEACITDLFLGYLGLTKEETPPRIKPSGSLQFLDSKRLIESPKILQKSPSSVNNQEVDSSMRSIVSPHISLNSRSSVQLQSVVSPDRHSRRKKALKQVWPVRRRESSRRSKAFKIAHRSLLNKKNSQFYKKKEQDNTRMLGELSNEQSRSRSINHFLNQED